MIAWVEIVDSHEKEGAKKDKPNAVEEWEKAQNELQSAIQGQKQPPITEGKSRLKSLRTSTDDIGSRVSQENKRVEHLAVLEGTIDV